MLHVGPARTYQDDDCEKQDTTEKGENVVSDIPAFVLARSLNREVHARLRHRIKDF